MKVETMLTTQGNPAKNQFEIYDDGVVYLQSYNSIIIKETHSVLGNITIELDKKYWDWSNTTRKYRNKFLGETSKQIKDKINSGVYTLVDLNND